MNNLEGLGYRGTTVVVTGASSGMGAAVAKILGELGAVVHAIDLKQPTVPHERFYATDLSNPEQVSATAAALRKVGPIHYLFNCAGTPSTVIGALQCMLVNYVGCRQLTDEILPAIVDGAAIANISSDAALGWPKNLPSRLELLAISDPIEARRWCEARPDALRDGYSSSKEMLIVWTLHRSVSLGRERGIRINCIAPGPTQTAFTDIASQALDKGYFDRFPYPLLGRIATATEQAWPLVLLNSPLNNVVTGAVLYTDQGFAGGLFTGSLDVSSIMPGAGAKS